MERERMRNAAKLILANGALDMHAKLNYTSAHRYCRRCGLSESLDYDKLEQAAHNVEQYRESDGCMIWEINIDQFADEYMRLAEESE